MSKQKPEKMNQMRSRIHEIIFEADTPLGRMFDIGLLILILISVVELMLASVKEVHAAFGFELIILDWIITTLFAIEYILRIYAVRKPWKYIFSFYGLVDLLAILPTFISPFITGANVLGNVRILRLFRVFRVLKLAPYLIESTILVTAMRKSMRKISVFLGMVLIIVVMVGSLMYFIEGQSNEKFSSIPRSMYWAIVTVTTVGYGDITPESPIGQFFSALLMILGYGVLAVPTGIVSVEMKNAQDGFSINTVSCESCGREGHSDDANYCKFCGGAL